MSSTIMPETMDERISRREYAKYAGLGIVAVALAGAGAYYFGRTKLAITPTITQMSSTTQVSSATKPTITLTKKPVISEYRDKFPPKIFNKIKVLVRDNEIDEGEQILINNLYNIELRRAELKKDFNITELEEKLIDLSLEDGTIRADVVDALKYMYRNPTDVQLNLINYGLDQTSFYILNQSVSYPNIDRIEPDVVYEMSRLPYIKCNEKARDILNIVYELAADSKYKEVFDVMLNQGIPKKRRQCTPLEALSWIIHDKGIEEAKECLTYSVLGLIKTAWTDTSISNYYKSDEWKGMPLEAFHKIADRLNFPEIVEMCMRDNFTYWYVPGEPEFVKTAQDVWIEKRGACYDHSVFAAFCLKRNGYDAKGMHVEFKRKFLGYFGGHVVCLYKDPKDSKYYTIDVWESKDKIHGPFNTIKDAAEVTCRGQGLARYHLRDVEIEGRGSWSSWI
jgi:hypothetical protein